MECSGELVRLSSIWQKVGGAQRTEEQLWFYSAQASQERPVERLNHDLIHQVEGAQQLRERSRIAGFAFYKRPAAAAADGAQSVVQGRNPRAGVTRMKPSAGIELGQRGGGDRAHGDMFSTPSFLSVGGSIQCGVMDHDELTVLGLVDVQLDQV